MQGQSWEENIRRPSESNKQHDHGSVTKGEIRRGVSDGLKAKEKGFCASWKEQREARRRLQSELQKGRSPLWGQLGCGNADSQLEQCPQRATGKTWAGRASRKAGSSESQGS